MSRKIKLTVVFEEAIAKSLSVAAIEAEEKEQRSASGIVNALITRHLEWPTDPNAYPVPTLAPPGRPGGKVKSPPKTVKTTLYLPVMTLRLLDVHAVVKGKDRAAIIHELVSTKLARYRVQRYWNP